MKIWDLTEFTDHEYLDLFISTELNSEDFSRCTIICPPGFDGTLIPGGQMQFTLALKIPFRDPAQRFFIAMLHLYSVTGSCSFPDYDSASESPSKLDLDKINKALVLLVSILKHVEVKNSRNLISPEFSDLLSSDQFISIGESGIAFKQETAKLTSIYSYYERNIIGECLTSSGTLRSEGVASALARHWSILQKDSHWEQICSFKPLKNRLSRIRSLLIKCHYSTNPSKLDYNSIYWPYIFACAAGWFYRLAINTKNSIGSSYSALCLSRSIELAIQAQALLEKKAHIKQDGDVYFGPDKIQGCGTLVELIKNKKIPCELAAKDLDEWVISIRTILSIRNHSRLAHGVLDIDELGLNDALVKVRNLIIEFLDGGLRKEFSETAEDLSIPQFKSEFRSIIQRLLINYLH